jgi:hypothetical protein
MAHVGAHRRKGAAMSLFLTLIDELRRASGKARGAHSPHTEQTKDHQMMSSIPIEDITKYLYHDEQKNYREQNYSRNHIPEDKEGN